MGAFTLAYNHMQVGSHSIASVLPMNKWTRDRHRVLGSDVRVVGRCTMNRSGRRRVFRCPFWPRTTRWKPKSPVICISLEVPQICAHKVELQSVCWAVDRSRVIELYGV